MSTVKLCWVTFQHIHVGVVQDVESKLELELTAGLDECISAVSNLMRPLEAATAAEVARLEDALSRCALLATELETLQQRAAAVE